MTSIANPGIDIVFVGDSIPTSGSSSLYQMNMAHLFKVKIQSLLNPPGVNGGFGFMPSSAGGASLSYQTGTTDYYAPLLLTGALFPTDSYATWSSSTQAEGTGLRHLGMGPLSNTAILFRAYGSFRDYATRRSRITGYQYIYRGEPGGGRIFVDTSSVTYAARGTGSFSTTIPTNQPVRTFGMRSNVFPIPDSNKIWYIMSRGDSIGTAGKAYIDGMIFYDGDEQAGVRVHNLTNPGSRLSMWNPGSLDASIGAWGSGLAGRNSKLFILSSILNDVLANSVDDKAYAASLSGIVKRIRRLASQPSIMILIPRMPDSFASQGLASKFLSFRSICMKLSVESNVAVFDMDEYMQAKFPRKTPVTYIFDGVHFNDAGHQLMSAALTDMLVAAPN